MEVAGADGNADFTGPPNNEDVAVLFSGAVSSFSSSIAVVNAGAPKREDGGEGVASAFFSASGAVPKLKNEGAAGATSSAFFSAVAAGAGGTSENEV